ncbi:transcriptional regulator [Leeuwenhoekiella sp. W20_SRS_FM14]|uniref:transcriptional regulator n=1 Tax=Leeuwenhoekiella sp. W20_SRS_FM14 TaxID=3240270 RepID=UPI003F99EF8B
MQAVLTGDIISSQSGNDWQQELIRVLNIYGSEPKEWELFRGDSFQLELQAEQALAAAIHIKAAIKTFSKLDVRIAIGLGDKNYNASKVTQSNGSAFVHSGTAFDTIKKNTLVLQSDQAEFDTTINLMLNLATLTMDLWPPVTAAIIKTQLEHPQLNQTELSELLGKAQSAISKALNRAGYAEITRLIQYYTETLKKY